jgi:signal transduction histidine kinase
LEKSNSILKTQRNGFISIILIIVFSFLLLYYINNISEEEVRNTLFNTQRETQMDTTKKIADHIGSDLGLVMTMLDGLANSIYLQQGDFYGKNGEDLIKEKYDHHKDIINQLFLMNRDDIVSISLADRGISNSLGKDLSLRDWVIQTKNTLQPSFSGGFERQGVYRIFITYPIISMENNDYLGMLVASIPTVKFFSHYANVENVNSSFVVSFDREGTILANGANNSLVGKNFFDKHVQNFINYNHALNNLTRNLLNGQPGYAVYDYGGGERLTTQYPVTVQNKHVFFIQLVTPTELLYLKMNEVLSSDRTKLFLLLSSIFALVVFLVFFLIKLNRALNEEVKRRTLELKESNKNLESMNKSLRLNDKVQKEFINTAAHELRTPIQPILGLTNILKNKAKDIRDRELLEVIIRNAQRLKKLSEDILEASKIEGYVVNVKKENFKLIDIIHENFNNYNNNIDNKNIEFECTVNEDLYLHAEKNGISRVISNLISNSIKFLNGDGKGGVISLSADLKKTPTDGKDSEEMVIVKVRDTGSGIDKEILPKLFTKFTTKSSHGIGLGLYISKNIVEAHGGKIWAQNNEDGNGATFSFSLPLNH